MPTTANPTFNPLPVPTMPTSYPTSNPSVMQTLSPSNNPTSYPTVNPSLIPSQFPTSDPTSNPTMVPTSVPSLSLTMNPTFSPSKVPQILQVPIAAETTSDASEMEVNHHETSRLTTSTAVSSTYTFGEQESNPLSIIIAVAATALSCAICFALCLFAYRIRKKQKKISDMHSSQIKRNLEKVASVSEVDKSDEKLDEVTTCSTPKVSAAVSNSLTIIKDHLARLTPTSSGETELAEMYKYVNYNRTYMASAEGHTKTTPGIKTRRGTMSIQNVIVYDGSEQMEIRQWLAVNCGQEICQEYFRTFISNGYQSLDFVKEIKTVRDLEDIGVCLKGHQTAILAAIRKLQSDLT